MDEEDGSYAPESPDLTAYHSTYSSNAPTSYYPPQQQSYQKSSYLPPNQDDSYAVGQQPIQLQDHHQSPAMPSNGRRKHAVEDDEWNPKTGGQTSASNGKKQKLEVDCDRPAPGVQEGIEVKTKFPVARIKRIMQADEDVGKVAQVTPTAVSKALELFMISVITKAANEASAVSAKRVTAAHLKQAIAKDEQFDFLADIISKVPDAPAPKKDDDSEEGIEGKKKKKGGAKKKKKDSDGF